MGDKVGDVLRGRYRLDKVLGEGSYGKVFRAHDTTTNSTVAIKIMNIGAAQNLTAYKEELAAYAQLSVAPGCHQYIVCLFDHFIIGLRAYEILELMDGDASGRLGPTTQATRLTFIRDLLAGMAFIHERNFAHRDLKPANVLVRGTSYKVGDLGMICSSTGQGGIGRCTLLGTPLFFPPEFSMTHIYQPITVKQGQQADVWALGATIFQVITGNLPYGPGTNIPGMKQNAVTPLAEGTSFGLVSASFINELVNAMLRVNPADRPTMKQLLDALNAEMVGCTQDDGRRINRTTISDSLTKMNVAHNAKAPLADLCNLLKHNLAKVKAPPPVKAAGASPAKAKAAKAKIIPVEPDVPCRLRGSDLPEGAFAYIASLFQVSGTRAEVCRQVNRMVAEQGLIDKRRIALVIHEGLLQAAKLELEGKTKEMELIERQILEIIELVAPVDGIDQQYLLDQYNNALAYVRDVRPSEEASPAVQLTRAFIRKYTGLTGTPQWAMLPKHATKVLSREVEMMM